MPKWCPWATHRGLSMRDELEKIYGSHENMEDAQVVEVRRRTLETFGGISDSTDALVLDPRGLLGNRGGFAGTEVVFDRPALLRPADLGPGKSWSSEGKAGTLNYELEARAIGAGAFESELGKFDDCLSVQTRLTLSGLPLPRTGSRAAGLWRTGPDGSCSSS